MRKIALGLVVLSLSAASAFAAGNFLTVHGANGTEQRYISAPASPQAPQSGPTIDYSEGTAREVRRLIHADPCKAKGYAVMSRDMATGQYVSTPEGDALNAELDKAKKRCAQMEADRDAAHRIKAKLAPAPVAVPAVPNQSSIIQPPPGPKPKSPPPPPDYKAPTLRR